MKVKFNRKLMKIVKYVRYMGEFTLTIQKTRCIIL